MGCCLHYRLKHPGDIPPSCGQKPAFITPDIRFTNSCNDDFDCKLQY